MQVQKLCGAAWVKLGAGLVWCDRPRGHIGKHDNRGRSPFVGGKVDRLRKQITVEERRRQVAQLDGALRKWAGRQVSPMLPAIHLAYLVKVGEIDKARDALKRAELKQKRMVRAIALELDLPEPARIAR